MGRPPAFQLYVKDWLTSKKRAAMELDQQAAYMNLLCHMWDTDDCSLPDNAQVLASLSELREKWNDRSTPVQQAFEPHPKKPGQITNMRLYLEHKKYREIQKKASAAGQASGLSRRENKGKPVERTFNGCSTNVQRTLNSSSSSSSSDRNPLISPFSEQAGDKSDGDRSGGPMTALSSTLQELFRDKLTLDPTMTLDQLKEEAPDASDR